jgi:hypothetical protein
MPRPVKDRSLRVGGRTVQVSSVAKPFFPDALLVKGDLLATTATWPRLCSPTWRGRPLNLQFFGIAPAVTGNSTRCGGLGQLPRASACG